MVFFADGASAAELAALWQRWQALATALIKLGWHRLWREQQVRLAAWCWFSGSQSVVC
jgi:hypothetical protein